MSCSDKINGLVIVRFEIEFWIHSQLNGWVDLTMLFSLSGPHFFFLIDTFKSLE